MARKIGVLSLFIFLLVTGSYIFVYLWRAFRIDGPNETTVRIWHGDDFTRTVLVSIFFLIGLTILGFLWTVRTVRGEASSVRIRSELVTWLESRGEETREPPSVLAERAIAAYRARLEGSPEPSAARRQV